MTHRLLSLLFALATLASSRAATTTWTGPLGGDWFAAGNWSDGLPNVVNSALIDTGIVLVGSNTTGPVAANFTLGGTDTNSTATLGISDNYLITATALIGRDAGSSGFLSVGSGGTLSAAIELEVGRGGNGVITVSNGGDVTAAYSIGIGVEASGTGAVSVSGSSSHFGLASNTDGGILVVGDRGFGDLQISDQGSVTGPDDFDFVTGDNGGHGKVTISSGGSLTATTIYAGYAGSSEIRVQTGGKLRAGDSFYLRSLTPGISSTLSVDGTGTIVRAEDMTVGTGGSIVATDDAFFLVEDTFTIGGSGTSSALDASLSLENSRLSAATVTSGTDARAFIHLKENGGVLAQTVTLGNLSEIVIDLAGTDLLDHGFIDADVVAFDGKLTLVLEDGFTPELNDFFTLFDFTSASGQFDSLALPALDPGLLWDTSALYTSGIVSIVPEPTTVALSIATVLVFALRRRLLSKTG